MHRLEIHEEYRLLHVEVFGYIPVLNKPFSVVRLVCICDEI